MSDYERLHPTDIIEQLRIRYEAIALVANVKREIEEYRIERGAEAETTPGLHLAEVDMPPEVLAAVHDSTTSSWRRSARSGRGFRNATRYPRRQTMPSTRGRR